MKLKWCRFNVKNVWTKSHFFSTTNHFSFSTWNLYKRTKKWKKIILKNLGWNWNVVDSMSSLKSSRHYSTPENITTKNREHHDKNVALRVYESLYFKRMYFREPKSYNHRQGAHVVGAWVYLATRALSQASSSYLKK